MFCLPEVADDALRLPIRAGLEIALDAAVSAPTAKAAARKNPPRITSRWVSGSLDLNEQLFWRVYNSFAFTCAVISSFIGVSPILECVQSPLHRATFCRECRDKLLDCLYIKFRVYAVRNGRLPDVREAPGR